jgi:hypothetical protein
VSFQYGAEAFPPKVPTDGASHNLIEHDQVTGFSDGVAFAAAPDEDIPAFSGEAARVISGIVGETLREGLHTKVKYSPPAGREPRYDTITANEMSADGLGISFGGPFRSNHIGTAPGPNDYQYYPLVLSSSVAAGNVTVQLRLDEVPTYGHETFKIDLYGQGSCEESSITPGLGEHFLGQSLLKTDLAGDGTTTMTVPLAAPASALTATATSPDGDTSELSPCLALGEKTN